MKTDVIKRAMTFEAFLKKDAREILKKMMEEEKERTLVFGISSTYSGKDYQERLIFLVVLTPNIRSYQESIHFWELVK